MPTTKVYKVQEIHCPSCALLIEGKLTTRENVIAAFVNLNQKILTVQYRENPFTPQELNALFQEEGYTFPDSSLPLRPKDSLLSIAIAALFVGLFLFWQKVPWGKSLSMHSQPSLWALFLFGAIAGTSNCAALVGSLIIALAREWAEKSQREKPTFSTNSSFTADDSSFSLPLEVSLEQWAISSHFPNLSSPLWLL